MGFNMSGSVLKGLFENLATEFLSNNTVNAPLRSITSFLERNGLFEAQLKQLKQVISARVLDRMFKRFVIAFSNNNFKEVFKIIKEFLERIGLLGIFETIEEEFKRSLSNFFQEEQFEKFMTAVKSKNTKEALQISKEFLEQNGLIGQFNDRLKELRMVIDFLQLVESTMSPPRTLHSSSMAGNFESVASLIQTGVEGNIRDGNGKMPLHYASEFGHVKVAKLLLEKGAKYNANSVAGKTPLQLAKSPEMRKLLSTVKTLFEDVRTGNAEKILQYISEESCIVNIQDKNGYSSLHWAALDGHKDIVKLLLEFGADVTLVSNKSNSPLHIAASKGHTEIVELLLQSVGRCNLQEFINGKTETGGNTPLHVAAERGYIDAVKILLSYGAVYSNRNKQGKTPLDLSKEWNCCNLLKLIEDLFKDAQKGSAEVISKLRSVEPPDAIAVSKARDVGNVTLMQVAFNAKHHNLGRMLVKVLKANYLN